jgi:hypothetical protein
MDSWKPRSRNILEAYARRTIREIVIENYKTSQINNNNNNNNNNKTKFKQKTPNKIINYILTPQINAWL